MATLEDESEDENTITERYEQRLIDLVQIQENPELLNDKEMSERLYTELDIAEHTIMLDGLPKTVPKQQLENDIHAVFVNLLELENIPDPEQQILRVVAVADMDKCIKWYQKLKIYVGRYQKILLTNKRKSTHEQSINNNSSQQRLKLKTKGKGMFSARTEEDALEYYQQKIDSLKTKIRDEEEKQNQGNVGKVFVVFKSRQISYRYRQ